MEVLSSRILLRPADLERSLTFYGTTLALPIYREFGEGDVRGVVFFLGGGFLEVSGRADGPSGDHVELWLQVRDLRHCHEDLLDAGVDILEAPARRPWGLDEMWIADPDGVRIAVIEVPPEHPLRRR